MSEPKRIETIDLVALVQNNPLTKLTSDYNSKILKKIQEQFSSDDQRLFVTHFFCYNNYNSTIDFIINLDLIWKWLGYSRISFCKVVLVKHFIEGVDYKIENFASEVAEAKIETNEETEIIKNGHLEHFNMLLGFLQKNIILMKLQIVLV